MPELLHQTIRLSGGRHSSPDDGMCVAELASVLAGEPFTDHPASVSRVIAAFLRTYNDRVDADRRQHLLPYAALVVGTRAGLEVERQRAMRCVTWAVDELGAPVPRLRPRLRRLARGLPGGSMAFCELAARWAAWRVPLRDDATHRAVLRLLDELLAIGQPVSRLTVPAATPAATAPAATSAAARPRRTEAGASGLAP
jgi:hypothetical protein